MSAAAKPVTIDPIVTAPPRPTRKRQLADVRSKKAACDQKAKERDAFADAGEVKYVDKKRAELMGEAPVEAPTRGEIDEARSDAEAYRAASAGFDPQIAALHPMVKSEESAEARETIRSLEKTRAHHEALSRWLLDLLGGSLTQLMAIDNLINFEFADPHASPGNWKSAAHLYGPGGVIREQLINLDWRTWPYSLRPSWAHPSFRTAPHLAPGLNEAMARVRAEIELEKSA